MSKQICVCDSSGNNWYFNATLDPGEDEELNQWSRMIEWERGRGGNGNDLDTHLVSSPNFGKKFTKPFCFRLHRIIMIREESGITWIITDVKILFAASKICSTWNFNTNILLKSRIWAHNNETLRNRRIPKQCSA